MGNGIIAEWLSRERGLYYGSETVMSHDEGVVVGSASCCWREKR